MKNWYKRRLYLWRLMDIGIWFLCGGLVSLGGALLGTSIVPALIGGAFQSFLAVFHAQGVQAKYYMLMIGLLLLLLAVLVVLVFTFPVIILYYGISFAARKNQLMRVTCKGVGDLDYFREELKGVSPATISLLMDLRIEGKKDLTATMLSLELKKKIRMEDGRPQILDDRDTGLLSSEKELLSLIRENRFDLMHLAGWQQICIQEARKAGYIKRNKGAKGFVGVLVVLTALLVLCVANVSSMLGGDLPFSEWEGDAPFTEALTGTEITSIGQLMKIMEKEMERPEVQSYMDEAVRGGVLIFSALLAFLLPGIILIYVLAFFLTRPRIIRTFRGKVLMGQIAGLKNFIHDFSNLKQADKEQLALWDHFLVYAVVLEENTSIVNEIGGIWKRNLSQYLLHFQ